MHYLSPGICKLHSYFSVRIRVDAFQQHSPALAYIRCYDLVSSKVKATAYLFQATLISLWWVGLSVSDEFFAAFQFPNFDEQAFRSFLIPDLVIIAVLSVVRAYNKKKALEWVILGGFAYATLYCVNASLLTGGGLISTTAMSLGLGYNLFLVFEERLFNESGSSSTLVNGLKTMVQILCVWTITLGLFPWLILYSFDQPLSPDIGPMLYLGIGLFIFFGFLGIYSSVLFVRHGKGTPIPIDQTKTLVTHGPYSFVRNPMAIAGVGQGIAVGIAYMSIPILAYSMLGGIIWHIVIRPLEEADLGERFGETYESYRKRVRCWIPRLRRR